MGLRKQLLPVLTVPRTPSRYARTQEPAVRDLLADLHTRWEQAARQRSQVPEASGEEVKPPLTQAEIAELVRRYYEDLDVPVRQIAADFDVSEATVYRIAADAGAHRQHRGGRSPRVITAKQ
ncbi:helix-turn-helix domain-containing protein [Nonomuraea sp. NPDC049480]|uniref:helix-turn-helix domain-containing protein n=1 Tax=Nonomuraea sp. NPDC049480 TaxID=3364353 RepID=UPI0037B55BED